MDRKKRSQAVDRVIADRMFSVARRGSEIYLIRTMGGKPITVVLKETEKGFWIEPPKREFKSSCSHFDFVEPETRWTRRKDVLSGLVKHLQKTKLWSFIENKNFFEINPLNKRVDKRVLKGELNSLLKPGKR